MNGQELLFKYLEHYILRDGEELSSEINSDSLTSIIDVSIVKRTARTYRQVGVLTLATDVNHWGDAPVPDPDLLKWRPGRRAALQNEKQAFEWLQAGWIIKEMRLKRDGKTTDKVCYRMGYRLFTLLQKRMEQEKAEHKRLLENFRLGAEQWKERRTKETQNERAVLLSLLQSRLITHCCQAIEELEGSDGFPAKWSTVKRIQFLHFVLAFVQVSSHQDVFDWKEIGAQYYGEIGGSKAFDMHKGEFIHNLELWAGQLSASLGLISPGQITPIYFAGHLEGRWSVHQPGPVHALTDLAVAQDQYHTRASTLWLVENRGILTRLAAERDFTGKSDCMIISVDGHIRSSHRTLVHQLVSNSPINQVLIWSDYDEDGLCIAKEMMEAVSARKLTLKWVCHDHEIITDWTDYQRYMKRLLQDKSLEQEQVLGGYEDWNKWISR
ncbi:DUF2399 domain-containing protein [Paenibacillus donghaensis]|uniref:DUF2399 domain-containing protein n=1 Tax=Paenibacillus donghaensis TaxID=414771 RepID=UPI001883B06E|nr:DUF2399 domain-containing protein [Paenibacillus donghaensis]MBE9914728.1 DUF2399 domain-containing protein [Paenibacillus donghaensis]